MLKLILEYGAEVEEHLAFSDTADDRWCGATKLMLNVLRRSLRMRDRDERGRKHRSGTSPAAQRRLTSYQFKFSCARSDTLDQAARALLQLLGRKREHLHHRHFRMGQLSLM